VVLPEVYEARATPCASADLRAPALIAPTRPGFEDADGRQYVEDDGERVYGTWLPPGDVPLVVEGLPRC
jgi:hypothetical protein